MSSKSATRRSRAERIAETGLNMNRPNGPGVNIGNIYNNRVVLAQLPDAIYMVTREPRTPNSNPLVRQRMMRCEVKCLSCGSTKATTWQSAQASGCNSCSMRASKGNLDPKRVALVRVINVARRGARDRGYEWSLSDNRVFELIYSACHYCGTDASNTCSKRGKYAIRYNGIDRVDNTLGYTVENSVACCSTCNRAKGDMSYDAFLAWLGRVALFLAAATGREESEGEDV